MEASVTSVNYVYPIKGQPVFRGSAEPRSVAPSSQVPYCIGKTEHIDNFVKENFFNEETGWLKVILKDVARFVFEQRRVPPFGLLVNVTKADCSALLATDAILNKLGTTVLAIPNPEVEGEPLVVMFLNGSKSIDPRIYSAPEIRWYRTHFDEYDENPIGFEQIADEVFDRKTMRQAPDGAFFEIQLKERYRGNPYITFAIHDKLNRECSIAKKTLETEELTASIASMSVQEKKG